MLWNDAVVQKNTTAPFMQNTGLFLWETHHSRKESHEQLLWLETLNWQPQESQVSLI